VSEGIGALEVLKPLCLNEGNPKIMIACPFTSQTNIPRLHRKMQWVAICQSGKQAKTLKPLLCSDGIMVSKSNKQQKETVPDTEETHTSGHSGVLIGCF
jgi:hypothetical protein